MYKTRRYSVVLHDVQLGLVNKRSVFEYIRLNYDIVGCVVAEEPYTHQDGSHIHIFINFRNTRNFKVLLKELKTLWPHGRVQLDTAHGSLAQGCKYLQKDYGKDKAYDPSPIYYPDRHIEKSQAEREQEAMSVLKKMLERSIQQDVARVQETRKFFDPLTSSIRSCYGARSS